LKAVASVFLAVLLATGIIAVALKLSYAVATRDGSKAIERNQVASNRETPLLKSFAELHPIDAHTHTFTRTILRLAPSSSACNCVSLTSV
jgi:hypothetical protein